MAISKIKGSAIQDATIPEEKLEDEAGSFRMILNASDGSATDAGDFLLLDATASSTNVGEQFLFEPATDDGSAVLSGDLNLEMDKKSTIKSEGGAVTTNIGQGLAKSWVRNNIAGGTPSIADSLNAASITDVAAGKYQTNLSSNMANANYLATNYCNYQNTNSDLDRYGSGDFSGGGVDARATTAAQWSGYWNTAAVDTISTGTLAHGDLA